MNHSNFWDFVSSLEKQGRYNPHDTSKILATALQCTALGVFGYQFMGARKECFNLLSKQHKCVSLCCTQSPSLSFAQTIWWSLYKKFQTYGFFFVPFESLILTQQFRLPWWKQWPNNVKSLWSLQTNCFFSSHNFGHMCQAFRRDPRRYFNINDHCLTLSNIPHILWAPSPRIYHQCSQQIFFLKAFSM